MTDRFLTEAEKAELRKRCQSPLQSPASWREVLALLDEIDAQAARIAELEAKVAAQDKTLRSWAGPVAGYAEDPAQQLKWAQERIAELEAHVRKWPTLECPCCGEEGAWAAYFQDGQETTCGCGGIVSADGEGAHILIDEDECLKCKETP